MGHSLGFNEIYVWKDDITFGLFGMAMVYNFCSYEGKAVVSHKSRVSSVMVGTRHQTCPCLPLYSHRSGYPRPPASECFDSNG